MANMMILKVNIIGKKDEKPYEFKLQFLKVFEETSAILLLAIK